MKVKFISLLILAILLIASFCIFVFYKQTKNAQTRKQTIRKMCMIGILSALSVILYFIKTPLPFFVSFLEIQFSNLPVLLGSFMFGPIEGAMIAIIRTIVKIPFTHTLCVGELQDLIISLAICCISGCVYMKKKTKKTAVVALIFSSIMWTLIAVLSNAFVSIPIYIRFMFNGNEEILANIIGQVIPNVTVENYLIKYLLLSCLPFNVLLSTLVSVVTFLVYKKSSILFKRFIDKGDEEDETNIGEC